MLIGDSIANGSWWTDQKETIAALITKNLGQNLTGSVQVLNASANSWRRAINWPICDVSAPLNLR
jgi:hypothetical protein